MALSGSLRLQGGLQKVRAHHRRAARSEQLDRAAREAGVYDGRLNCRDQDLAGRTTSEGLAAGERKVG